MRRVICQCWLLVILVTAGCNLGTAVETPTLSPTIAPTLSPPPTRIPTRVSTVELSPTPTLMPTFTRIPTLPPPTITPTPRPDAQVSAGVSALRLRDRPGLDTLILTHLAEFLPLRVIGRTADNNWLQVIIPDGTTGWVSAAYVDVTISLDGVGVTGEVATAQPTAVVIQQPGAPTSAPPPQPVSYPVISNITSRSREIYQRGQQLGNRAGVFSKIGDSLTVATYVLYPIGWGAYNLHGYGGLLPVIQYFSAENAREGNSFANISLSADNGWTTEAVLDPNRANPAICQPGETPLACEYRVVRPSIALILLGTNDVGGIPAATYAANLGRIVEQSINAGVIPVISTIPERFGFDGQVAAFNQIITNTAYQYSIPLWDYGGAMRALPNNGLSADGVHPSWPPPGENYAAAADFSPENLQYGYTLRNLTALQVLDALWRQVILG